MARRCGGVSCGKHNVETVKTFCLHGVPLPFCRERVPNVSFSTVYTWKVCQIVPGPCPQFGGYLWELFHFLFVPFTFCLIKLNQNSRLGKRTTNICAIYEGHYTTHVFKINFVLFHRTRFEVTGVNEFRLFHNRAGFHSILRNILSSALRPKNPHAY